VPGSRQDSLALFQIKKVHADRLEQRNVQLFREQADARTKRNHLSVFSRFCLLERPIRSSGGQARSPAKAKLAQEARLFAAAGKH